MSEHYLGRSVSIFHRMTMSQLAHGLKECQDRQWAGYVLLELFYCDGIRQEELSRLLNIDRANTTRAINKLVQEGYVRRQPDPEDGRAHRVYLTEKGPGLKPDLFNLLGSWDEELLGALTPDEQDLFLTLLRKMGQAVRTAVAALTASSSRIAFIAREWFRLDSRSILCLNGG